MRSILPLLCLWVVWLCAGTATAELAIAAASGDGVEILGCQPGDLRPNAIAPRPNLERRLRIGRIGLDAAHELPDGRLAFSVDRATRWAALAIDPGDVLVYDEATGQVARMLRTGEWFDEPVDVDGLHVRSDGSFLLTLKAPSRRGEQVVAAGDVIELDPATGEIHRLASSPFRALSIRAESRSGIERRRGPWDPRTEAWRPREVGIDGICEEPDGALLVSSSDPAKVGNLIVAPSDAVWLGRDDDRRERVVEVPAPPAARLAVR